jgi:hypothetical protein
MAKPIDPKAAEFSAHKSAPYLAAAERLARVQEHTARVHDARAAAIAAYHTARGTNRHDALASAMLEGKALPSREALPDFSLENEQLHAAETAMVTARQGMERAEIEASKEINATIRPAYLDILRRQYEASVKLRLVCQEEREFRDAITTGGTRWSLWPINYGFDRARTDAFASELKEHYGIDV